MNDSLVLMMNFDNASSIGEVYNNSNNSIIKDVSGYGNDGSGQGDVRWNSTGKYGGAYQFDGVNDYVGIPNLSNTDEFTIAMWIYPQGNVGQLRGLFGNQGWVTGNIHFQIASATNLLGSAVWSGNYLYGTTVFNDSNLNKWFHVAVTYSKGSNSHKLYVNTVNEDADNAPVTMVLSSLRIGSTYDQTRFFNGTIDQVMIFNRSLSASEIQQLYYSNLNKYDTDKWLFYANVSNQSDGIYTYEAHAKDIAGNWNNTGERVITTDTINPNITLNEPLNDTWSNSSIINFKYNMTDTNPDTCILYHNATGWNANETNSSLNSGQQDTVTITLADGAYLWNVYCNDTSGRQLFYENNYTLKVDTLYPVVSFAEPTPLNNTYRDVNWAYINISTNETNAHSVVLDWNSSIIGWWRFDDRNSTAIFDYLNRYNATLGNWTLGTGPTYTSLGKFGGAMSFDGINNSINIGNITHAKEMRTISFWAKFNNLASSQEMVSKSHAGSGVEVLIFQNKIQFFAMNSAGSDANVNFSINDVDTTNWWYITATQQENDQMKLYLNGVLKSNISTPSNITDSDRLIIGNWNYDQPASGIRPFNGTIDDVIIFNRALGSDEISSLYNATRYEHNFTSLIDANYTYKAYAQD